MKLTSIDIYPAERPLYKINSYMRNVTSNSNKNSLFGFKYIFQTFMFSPLWSVIRRSTSGIEFPTMSGTNNEWARVWLLQYNTYLYSIKIHLLQTAEGPLLSSFLRIFFKLFGFTRTLQKLQLHWISTESHHKNCLFRKICQSLLFCDKCLERKSEVFS